MAALLLGGSGALIGLYRYLASRIRVAWLAKPLREVLDRPRLIWGVHLGYFGLVIVSAIWIYEMPEFQALLLSLVRGVLSAKGGPMATVADAYISGNVLRAAALTFLVNYILGTLLQITLPAMIVPGSGMVIPVVRSSVWGMLFAPTFASLAHGLLAHSGTMLLEGAGYILAAFFGLLIPVHACEPKLGGDFFSRVWPRAHTQSSGHGVGRPGAGGGSLLRGRRSDRHESLRGNGPCPSCCQVIDACGIAIYKCGTFSLVRLSAQAVSFKL